MTSGRCPCCCWTEYFGPAVIIRNDTGEEFKYVTCRKCGSLVTLPDWEGVPKRPESDPSTPASS